jgi:hypothetical protein
MCPVQTVTYVSGRSSKTPAFLKIHRATFGATFGRASTESARAWLSEVVSPVVADSLLGSPVEAVITRTWIPVPPARRWSTERACVRQCCRLSAVRLLDGRTIPVERLTDTHGSEREFLRAISASACGYFTTVLGPGSDVAHSRHLHVDLAERRIP